MSGRRPGASASRRAERSPKEAEVSASHSPSRSLPSTVRSASALCLALLLLLAGAIALHAESFIWVDQKGVTHITDDPAAVPDHARSDRGADVDRLRGLWSSELTGPVPVTPPGSSGSSHDRVTRLVAGAVQDISRGETARAAATLRAALRLEPRRPEPHWYLASLDHRRGRYASAAEHLQTFLAAAGPQYGQWRALAQRRIGELADERRLADESTARQPLELVITESPHFRIQLDSELSRVKADYANTALGFLDDARVSVSDRIGVSPLEPLGVVFYGRAAYSRAYRHRFSFQTVGFFDGRIHVSSPAHPTGALRSLLFHEYTHAVFRDQTGGDRPYWLNEGLAEQIERAARSHPVSTRSERSSLRMRIEAGDWIPLRRLAPSFSGLSDADARAAYLESAVAVELIESRTDRAGRAQLLGRLGEGLSADQALYEAIGLDTKGLDAAVQARILSEFPAAMANDGLLGDEDGSSDEG